MAPHAEGQEADGDACVDHHRRAEEGLGREGGDHLGDDAHGGQDQDVDLRMGKDPEEMLPEQGIAARGGREEERAEKSVEHQEDHPDRQGWKGQQHKELRHQHHPHEDRHPEELHARRAHVDDRHHEVEGAQDG